MVLQANREPEELRVTAVHEVSRVNQGIQAEKVVVANEVKPAFQELWASRVPEVP